MLRRNERAAIVASDPHRTTRKKAKTRLHLSSRVRFKSRIVEEHIDLLSKMKAARVIVVIVASSSDTMEPLEDTGPKLWVKRRREYLFFSEVMLNTVFFLLMHHYFDCILVATTSFKTKGLLDIAGHSSSGTSSGLKILRRT